MTEAGHDAGNRKTDVEGEGGSNEEKRGAYGRADGCGSGYGLHAVLKVIFAKEGKDKNCGEN